MSQKTDTPIMSHNSSKNRKLSIIFDLFNRPSVLDTLPLKLSPTLMQNRLKTVCLSIEDRMLVKKVVFR